VTHIIKGGFPQGILLVFVFQGDRIGDMLLEVAVGNGELYFAAVVFEVIAQGIGYGEDGFFRDGLLSSGDAPGENERGSLNCMCRLDFYFALV